MSKEPNYHELSKVPSNWTRAVWNAPGWVANKDEPYKWSGDADPPAIGAKVKCYINDLGDGTVVGYFAECGWLGVLVKLKKNPERRKELLKGKNPPAHIFGVELQPRKIEIEK